MKKISALLLILSCTVATTWKFAHAMEAHVSDSAKDVILANTQAYNKKIYEEVQNIEALLAQLGTPTTTIPHRHANLLSEQNRAIGEGGCWRACWSACLSPSKVDKLVHDTRIAYNILMVVSLAVPPIARELLLVSLCGAYVLSDLAARVANKIGLLDDKGNLKPGWGKIFLAAFRKKGTAILDEEDFHFEQAVIDLKEKLPDIIAALTMRGAQIPAEFLAILYTQYHLIKDPTTITEDERTKILHFAGMGVDSLTAGMEALSVEPTRAPSPIGPKSVVRGMTFTDLDVDARAIPGSAGDLEVRSPEEIAAIVTDNERRMRLIR